jgi:hypothetical protein
MFAKALRLMVCLCLVMITRVSAQTVDLKGTWVTDVVHEGRTYTLVLRFDEVKGDKVTGTMQNMDNDERLPMHKGKISGNQITFRTGNNDAIVYTGTVKGDKIDMLIEITDQVNQDHRTTFTKKKSD